MDTVPPVVLHPCRSKSTQQQRPSPRLHPSTTHRGRVTWNRLSAEEEVDRCGRRRYTTAAPGRVELASSTSRRRVQPPAVLPSTARHLRVYAITTHRLESDKCFIFAILGQNCEHLYIPCDFPFLCLFNRLHDIAGFFH